MTTAATCRMHTCQEGVTGSVYGRELTTLLQHRKQGQGWSTWKMESGSFEALSILNKTSAATCIRGNTVGIGQRQERIPYDSS